MCKANIEGIHRKPPQKRLLPFVNWPETPKPGHQYPSVGVHSLNASKTQSTFKTKMPGRKQEQARNLASTRGPTHLLVGFPYQGDLGSIQKAAW